MHGMLWSRNSLTDKKSRTKTRRTRGDSPVVAPAAARRFDELGPPSGGCTYPQLGWGAPGQSLDAGVVTGAREEVVMMTPIFMLDGEFDAARRVRARILRRKF